MPGGGRPDPDPQRRQTGPGATGGGWNRQRGDGPVPGGAGAPRRNKPSGPIGPGDSNDGFGTRQRRTGGTPAAPDRPQSPRAPAFRWLGTLSTRGAVYVLLAAALLGVIGTVVTGREPGFLLGFCAIVGSIIAACAIRRGRLHMLIPLPALVLFFGGVITGALHDRGVDTSTTEIGVNFLQWIANVFFAMCAATILVLVIAGGRWLLSRQLVAGQFPMSASPGPRPRPAPGSRPAGSGPGPRGPREARGGARWNGSDLRTGPEQRASPPPFGNRGVPPDRDRRGAGGRRDTGDLRGPRNTGDLPSGNGRGERPSWTPRDQRDPRTPRSDRPRPPY
jgi:hypothetical protein